MHLLRTFGGLSLETGDIPGRQESSVRRLALLAIIGVHRRGVTRESLLPIFWPESDEERARNALNQALFVLRQALPDGAIAGSSTVLRLSPDVLACDAAQFDEAMESGRVEQAVALYRGPFLDGVHLRDASGFERWRDSEAARLARSYGEALERLAVRAENEGDTVAAVGWWQRLAAVDRYNSRIALRLMKAYVAAGDPAGAIRHAHVHQVLLEEDLGVACDDAVGQLADRIRLRVDNPPAIPRVPRGPAPENEQPESGVSAHDAPAEPTVPSATRARRGRQWTVAKAAIAALIAAVIILAMVISRNVAASPPESIAVLPFRILDSNAGTVPEYVRDGLTDGVINTLGQIRNLRVIARSSSYRFHDGDVDVTDVADRLRVDAVLVGSIQPAGPTFRVLARLVDGSRGQILWSGTFERDTSDVVALESDIVSAIARSLGPGARRDVDSSPPGSTRNARAHALFLQGLYLWNLRRPDDLRRAIHFFESAIAEDSAYGLPHAMIAHTHMLLALFREVPVDDAARAAAASAQRALELDPRISLAHSVLGTIHQTERQWDAAEREFRRAIELNPNDATAHSAYAFLILYTGGNHDRALREFELAHRLDPMSIGILSNLGWGYYFTRRYGQALDAFQRVLELDTANFAMHNGVGRALVQLGRRDEALAAHRRAVALGGTPQGKAFLANALARYDQAEEALAIRAEIMRSTALDPLLLAIVDTGLGERDRAFAGLQSPEAQRSPILLQVSVDPVFDPLRNDPRYTRFLQEIGVPPPAPR